MKENPTRLGDWFVTYTDTKFYPLDPRPDEINIRDIAHGLAMICRFGGHTNFHYSVAQHSLLVSLILEQLGYGDNKAILLQGLMHDGPEAYCGDMVRPLKMHMPDFQVAEGRIWEAICERYNIEKLINPAVHRADMMALLTEKRDVRPPSAHVWDLEKHYQPSEIRICRLSPEKAKELFMCRFAELYL